MTPDLHTEQSSGREAAGSRSGASAAEPVQQTTPGPFGPLATRGALLTPPVLVAISRTAGNRAVARLLAEPPPDRPVAGPAARRGGRGPARGPVVAGRRPGPVGLQRDLTRDPPSPEWTSPDLTGHYEGSSEGIGYTLQLSQAGHYVEGWMQRHGPGAASLVTSQIRGDWVRGRPEGSLVEFAYERQGEYLGRPATWRGTLTGSSAAGTFELRISETRQGPPPDQPRQGPPPDQPPHVYEFRRTDTRARPSAASIRSTGSAAGVVGAAERAPLTLAEDAVLVELARYLVTDAQTDGPGRPEPGERAGAIEEVQDVPHGPVRAARAGRVSDRIASDLGRFAQAQLPLVRRRLQALLTDADHQVTHLQGRWPVRRPAWDWLQILVSTYPDRAALAASLMGMTPFGGVLAQPGWRRPEHHYTYSYALVGASLGVGGYFARFQIGELRRAAPEGSRDYVWGPDEYYAVLGQVGASAGVGAQVWSWSPPQAFTSRFPWRSATFDGRISLEQASVGAGAGVGGTVGVGTISFHGDEQYPPIRADAGGFQAGLGSFAVAELTGAGAHLVGGRREATPVTPATAPLRARAAMRVDERTYFEVDEPHVSALGRQRLREFCARYRAEFESPRSTLTIEGFTSTTAGPRHNEALSLLRAQNVLQTIRDILGPAGYRIPTRGDEDYRIEPLDRLPVVAHGRGEAPAAGHAREVGQPTDEFEDPAWRRVDVRLNGRIVLTLQ